MYCEKCGKQIIDNTNKCSFCGTPLENKMIDTCFTDDEYLTFKVCGVLASVAIIGIVIIFYLVISSDNNTYNTEGIKEVVVTNKNQFENNIGKKSSTNENTTNNTTTKKEKTKSKYDDKYTSEFIFEVDGEENTTYSREEKISICEDFFSKALYNDWYYNVDDEMYSIDENIFMGYNYKIDKFSYSTDWPNFVDILVVLDDDYSFEVHIHYDIYSDYGEIKDVISSIETEEGFFYSNITTKKYYTVKYDEVKKLDEIVADIVEQDNEKYNEYAIYSGEYIFPYSSIEYLSEDDVRGLSKEYLRLARNEIFARYGYVFNSEDLQEYFESKSWYTPDYSGNISEDMLNDYEKANVALIKSYE